MKQRRLTLLLGVMLVLLAFRWLVPPSPDARSEVVTAVVRAPSAMPEPPAQAVARMVAESKQAPLPVAEADGEVVGNAFSVRAPPVPPPTPAPPPSPRPPRVKRAAIIETPAPTVVAEPLPPAAPDLKIIGTWNDGDRPAVFVAGPLGTLIAREGTVLFSEYRVTGLDARHLSLVHIVSQHAWQLPIPQVQARP